MKRKANKKRSIKRKANKRRGIKRKANKKRGMKHSIFDDIRQWRFPPEFRIAYVGAAPSATEAVEVEPPAVRPAQAVEPPAAAGESLASNQLVAEFATSLWYLKTKYFKRAWDDAETGDSDPRTRRALSRLNRSIEALKASGIELHDPTNKRYPTGGEGMMRPIQFLPAAGLTFEVVSETVTPIIYRNERLIQRGEVFVAVPKEKTTAATGSTTTSTDAVSDVDAPADSIPLEADAHTAPRDPSADAGTVEPAAEQGPGSGTDIAGSEPDEGERQEDSTQEPTGKDN